MPKMLKWFLRRVFWDFIAFGKFALAKPLNIRPPRAESHIEPKPMFEAIPEVPLRKVMVCPRAQIPPDERNLRNTKFYDLQVWLCTTRCSPMQPGLPSIDLDAQAALKRAFNGLRRKRFHAPELPAEYLSTPDLGLLAARGPYACYTKRLDDTTWEWDLTALDQYEHHSELVQIGSRVLFREDPVRRSLQADSIECRLGTGKGKSTIRPTNPEWGQACKIALCAASTHLSLVRHFNWVHLAGGAQLAIATRNSLSRDHPLFRLLWPYIYATQQSNDMVTRGQMAPGGDFETTFSFTRKGMCDLFDSTYGDYQHTLNDPETDGDSRGVRSVAFETPTQQNLEQLFNVMHDFVRDYLGIYYPQNSTGINDVCRNPGILAWLRELNRLVPNGVGVDPGKFAWAELARMVTGQLYLVTVQHEILGSLMWNYQLWTHRQPARIYIDLPREPLDVYQRLVNANYILNVHRRALMHNFDDVALDDKARAAMARFQSGLLELQAKMDSHPRAVWKVYPRDLKVNINA
jgi:Lipoxygenase